MKVQANAGVVVPVKAINIYEQHWYAPLTVLPEFATRTCLSKYKRLAARRGPKRAAVAVAHTMLVCMHAMLKYGVPYKTQDMISMTNSERTGASPALYDVLKPLATKSPWRRSRSSCDTDFQGRDWVAED